MKIYSLRVLMMSAFVMIALQQAFAQKLLNPTASGGFLSGITASSAGVNSSITLAYSVRQLKSTYDHAAITAPSAVSGFTNSSTPLLRVRRDSDNGQLDIGYTSSGMLDTVTLISFVGSGSGYVSVWYDQSGNSRDATQATTTTQPRIVNAGVLERNENGIPSIVDYGGKALDNTSNTSYGITGDRTIIVVAQPKAYSNGLGTDGSGSYLMDRTNASTDLCSIKITNDNWTLQLRDATNITDISAGFAVSTSRSDAVMLVRSGTATFFYVNGEGQSSQALVRPGTLAPVRIGYGANGAASNMCFEEVIVLGSALSTENITTLYNNQNASFKQPQAKGKLLDNASLGGPISGVSAAVAYSIRQLKSYYTHNTITAPATVSGFTNSPEPLIRVRRSSDNAQLDLGYDYNGNLDTVKLKNFVSSNGANPTASGYVAVWYDQSGNSRDAFQTSTGSQPRIVNSGVLDVNKSGVPGIMTVNGQSIADSGSANRYGITGDRTLNVICQPKVYTNASVTSGGGTYVFDRNVAGGGNPLTSFKIDSDKWGLQFRNDAGSGLSSSFAGSTAVNVNRTDNITIIRSGDAYSFEVNSVLMGTATLSGANSMDAVKLGYGSAQTETVYYGEVLLFGSALSVADRDAMNNNQNSFFAIGEVYTWTGATSTDWSTASNWSGNTVPDEGSNVVIPSGTANTLTIIIPQTFKIRKLTVNSGATVSHNGNVLNVTDSVIINGTVTGVGYIGLSGSRKQYFKGTFGKLYNNNTTDTVYAYGNVDMAGLFTLASTMLDMGTYTLQGMSVSNINQGTVRTACTSNPPLPTGKTWLGTVEYYAASGGQTISDGTYKKLKLSNTSGTNTAAGSIVLNDTLTVRSGGIFDLTTYQVTGTGTISNSGTIKTANTTNPPLPTGKTWGGTVEYYATDSQTVSNGTYNNLAVKTGTKNAAGNLTVNGTLTITGVLDMKSYVLSGSLAGISNAGTLNTANTSANPIPSGKNWGGSVVYNATTGGQTVVNGFYTTLSLQNSSGTNVAGADFSVTHRLYILPGSTLNMGTYVLSGSLNSPDVYGTLQTAVISGPFPTGKTWVGTISYNAPSGGQTIMSDATYTNLTMGNTSGTQTPGGNITVNGTLTTTSGGTLSMGTNTFSGTLSTITNNGTISTTNTTTTPLPSGKTWGGTGTVQYAVTTGGQKIVSGTYNKLLLSNTSGTDTAGGNIVLNDTLTIQSGGTFDLATYQMTGTSGTISNSGTVKTANTLNPPLPAGKTWGGTVEYYATTGGQYVADGTYNNLTLSNTSGSATATGNLTVNGTLITPSGGTLDLVTYTLGGTLATITNNGIIKTSNTSATPLPSGKTWGGTIEYGATTGSQTVMGGATATYNNLTLSNTSGTSTANGNLTINGTLTTTAGGTLDMGTNTFSGTTTFTNNGTIKTANTSATPIPASKVWGGTIDFNNATGGQSIVNGSYTNLSISGSSGTSTATTGQVTVTNNFTVASGITLDMASFILWGPLNGTITINGTVKTATTNPLGFPGGRAWNGTGTIEFYNSVGGQTIPSGTFNNITASNTSGTQTCLSVTVNGTLTVVAGSTVDLGTNVITGSSMSVANSGTIKTAKTGSASLPSSKTWGGTVEYYAAAGSQTIATGTYNNLLMSNTSGTQSLGGTTTVGATITFSGGKLALGSNTLNINGSLSGHSATASLVANASSNLSIGGSGALGSGLFFDQTTPGTTNRLTDFTYNRSSQTITLSNALQVIGTVTPTAGTLATGGLLTLTSNASATGRIAAGTGTYITGNVTAERYIPSVARRWRFMASPVSGSTLADWKNEIYITGAGGAANGFDATLSNAAGVYYYNETAPGEFNANGWVAATSINETLTPGKGFRVFIRGDRSDPGVLNGNTGTQAAVTMNAIGAVNTGNITMPVSYTNSGSNANDGWSFVGNPYPSPIDWNAFHDAGRTGSSPDYSGTDYTHLDAVASVYDVNIANYASYNAASNIGTGAFSNGIIPSGGSFWVKASAASPSMTMKEIYKTGSTPAAMFKTESPQPAFSLKLSKDEITADEMVVKYMNEANANFDLYDIAKLNGEVNISSVTENGTLLTGNCKPFNGISDSIRLNITVAKSGNYFIEAANVKQLASGKNIYLIDAFSHRVLDLNAPEPSGSRYDFVIDKDNASSYGSNRFMLVVGDMKPVETGISEEVAAGNNISIYPALTDGEVTISNTHVDSKPVSVTIIDAGGRVLATLQNLQWSNNSISLDLSQYKSGAYIIAVRSDSVNTMLKCVKYE